MTIGKNRRDDLLQSQTGFLEDVNGILLNMGGPGPFDFEGQGRSVRLMPLSIKGQYLGG